MDVLLEKMGFRKLITLFILPLLAEKLPRGNVMKLQRMTSLRTQFKQKAIDYSHEDLVLTM